MKEENSTLGLSVYDIFFVLNFMPHAILHRSRESKSLCRASQSALERLGRYMRQSSANSLICEVMTDV